ncbi:MAG: hypothetical protein H0W01_10510 [Pseudonocardiales bacterium]|nr:hypothetical protein [Pseudonocardiales bacterium]
MSQAKPSKPYVPHIPRPGSLQEWMVRALAVRSVQEHNDQVGEPASAPMPCVLPEQCMIVADAPRLTHPAVAAGAQRDQPAATAQQVPLAPRADRIRLAARTQLARLAAGPRPVRLAARAGEARLRTAGTRNWWLIALIAVLTALLAVGVGGWQLSQAAGGDGDTVRPADVATGQDVSAATVTKPFAPAAFGQVVKLGGWQMKVAGLKNSPQLKVVPGLTSAAYPRALRMSVTLINATNGALAADGWILSATVNGKPVQMIVHPATGYVGVPQQTIQPGGSVVFPIAVAMPTSLDNLTVDAVNAEAGLAVSFTGKG